MDLYEAIVNRRSASRLGEPAPNNLDLQKILTAAVCAPDHGRLSPWRFHVMQGERRALLSDAMATLLRARHPDATAEMIVTERGKALRAPMIIAVAARTVSGHKVPESEQVLAVAAAVQNILLAATALGYGAMWKTGAPAYDNSVKAALGFSATDQLVGFVYLGTTVTAGKPRAPALDGLIRHL